MPPVTVREHALRPRSIPGCLALFLVAIGWLARAASAAEVDYLAVRGSAFHLAVDDLEGDGADELIYATYDGWVRCADAATARTEHWAYRIDHFPTALLVRAERRGAAPCIFVADVDGRLTALAADGRERWRWEAGLALHGVAWVRLGGGRAAQIGRAHV